MCIQKCHKEKLNMRTTYGNHGNIFEDQYKYMDLRLLAKKSGKINTSDEDISQLEDQMKEIRKQFKVDEKIEKVEQTEEVVLLSKISKLENTLNNKKFLDNVSDSVKDVKVKELEKLKEELEKF